MPSKQTVSTYARPELLVETEWLARHLNDPKVRLVDMGPFEGYARAHIPGAVHPGPGDRSHYLKDPADMVHVIPPEAFAELMGRLGIGDGTTVIAYDADGGHTAARLWWALDYYGHANCKLLNGGWNKWTAEGRPVSMAVPQRPRATFTPRVVERRICKLPDLKGYATRRDACLLDVRSDGEWDGSNTRGNKRAGHIPGAAHLEWRTFVTDGELRTFKPAHELRRLLQEHGVTPDKLVVTY